MLGAPRLQLPYLAHQPLAMLLLRYDVPPHLPHNPQQLSAPAARYARLPATGVAAAARD